MKNVALVLGRHLPIFSYLIGMSDDIEIVEKLKSAKTSLYRRYSISDISVFGPHSKGEGAADVDVDLLVTFKNPIGMRIVDLEDELRQLLGYNVDITPRKTIERKYLKDIRKELIQI